MTGTRRVVQVLAGLALLGARLPAQTIRVAQTPLRIELKLTEWQAVQATFDSLLGERLREQGFELIPPTVYDSLRRSLRDSIGGYFDPFTGRVIDSLFQIVVSGTRDHLRADFGAQAMVYQMLDVLRIRFGGGKVEWYGATEEGGGRGGLEGFLFGRSYGTMPGLTLIVTVQDMTGRRLAHRAGGIQLMSHIEGGKFVDTPREKLLVDPALMTRAVRHATDSLPELIRQGLQQ
jgi:hypothetical protein